MLIEVVEGAYSLSLPATTRQLLIATKIGSNWHICPQICTYVKPECNIRDDRSALKRGKKKVLKTLLVIAVGFLPSLFSLWVIRKTRSRSRLRMRQAAMNFPRMREGRNFTSPEGDRYYLEGVGYLIGDISCKFNARSGYIRCAVNPDGPCNGCRHYEPKELAGEKKV